MAAATQQPSHFRPPHHFAFPKRPHFRPPRDIIILNDEPASASAPACAPALVPVSGKRQRPPHGHSRVSSPQQPPSPHPLPNAVNAANAVNVVNGGRTGGEGKARPMARPLHCRVCRIRFTSLQQFAEHRMGQCRGFLPASPAFPVLKERKGAVSGHASPGTAGREVAYGEVEVPVCMEVPVTKEASGKPPSCLKRPPHHLAPISVARAEPSLSSPTRQAKRQRTSPDPAAAAAATSAQPVQLLTSLQVLGSICTSLLEDVASRGGTLPPSLLHSESASSIADMVATTTRECLHCLSPGRQSPAPPSPLPFSPCSHSDTPGSPRLRKTPSSDSLSMASALSLSPPSSPLRKSKTTALPSLLSDSSPTSSPARSAAPTAPTAPTAHPGRSPDSEGKARAQGGLAPMDAAAPLQALLGKVSSGVMRLQGLVLGRENPGLGGGLDRSREVVELRCYLGEVVRTLEQQLKEQKRGQEQRDRTESKREDKREVKVTAPKAAASDLDLELTL